jgi:hypothetical protein
MLTVNRVSPLYHAGACAGVILHPAPVCHPGRRISQKLHNQYACKYAKRRPDLKDSTPLGGMFRKERRTFFEEMNLYFIVANSILLR